LTPCLAVLVFALASCAAGRETIRIVDLVHECRAPRCARRDRLGSSTTSPRVDPGRRSDNLPSRLVFTLPIPRRSTFRTAIALGGADPASIQFRIGVSDDRIYEALVDRTLTSADVNRWTDIQTDLSAYAGWKWSLFYRPERQRWRLVLNTDVVTGTHAQAVWGARASTPTWSPPKSIAHASRESQSRAVEFLNLRAPNFRAPDRRVRWSYEFISRRLHTITPCGSSSRCWPWRSRR
jgi:hypothetical protein